MLFFSVVHCVSLLTFLHHSDTHLSLSHTDILAQTQTQAHAYGCFVGFGQFSINIFYLGYLNVLLKPINKAIAKSERETSLSL